MSKIVKGITNSFVGFFVEGLILSALVGYGFHYLLVQIYPQIAGDYLYIGIVGVVWILFVSISTKIAKKMG